MSERPLPLPPVWRWWAGFFAVTLFALFMTSLAYREGLPEFFQWVWNSDKIAHFVTAGLLAFFLDGALRRRDLTKIGGVAIPLAAVAVLVPVGIEEFVQRYSSMRNSSLADFIADVLGVVVLVPLSRRLGR